MTKRIGITLSDKTFEELTKLSEEIGLTKSNIIQLAISDLVQKQKRKAKK